MAGGKLNARQKMINMMYLVLTAILALNVAKEVLDAFVVINMGLLQQKESLEGKNTAMLNQFNTQLLVDSSNQRLQFLNKQALFIKKISDELNTDIEKMKVDLVVQVDGVDVSKAVDVVNNPIKVDKKDNYDGPTRYFGTDDPPGTKGKAHELKQKISTYREQCMQVVDQVLAGNKNPNSKELRTGIEKKLDLLLTKDPASPSEFPTWEMQYFYHLPLAAALTELTKWENFVKGAELDMLNFLWEEIARNVYKFDAIRVAVIPKSNFVTSGANFEADVFLAAYSSGGNNLPTIVYGSSVDTSNMHVPGGTTLEKDHYVNGVGKVSFPVSGAGEKTFAGTLQIKDPSGNLKTLPFSTTYNVAPPSATVSPDMMNVFYYGLSNPVSVSVPGVASNNISVSGTNCTLTGSNGHYQALPTQQSGKAYVNVSARMQDGTSRPMGRYEFRIKTVPTPQVRWGQNKTGFRVPAQEGTQPLIPYMENFDFNIFPVVTSFDFSVSRGDGDSFGEKGVRGSQIPAKYHPYLKTLKRGSKVYFDNIKMTVPGGTRTTSCTWEIQ